MFLDVVEPRKPPHHDQANSHPTTKAASRKQKNKAYKEKIRHKQQSNSNAQPKAKAVDYEQKSSKAEEKSSKSKIGRAHV